MIAIAIRFKQENNYSKEYWYYVSSVSPAVEKFLFYEIDRDMIKNYHYGITNTEGYDYRGSEVIITRISCVNQLPLAIKNTITKTLSTICRRSIDLSSHSVFCLSEARRYLETKYKPLKDNYFSGIAYTLNETGLTIRKTTDAIDSLATTIEAKNHFNIEEKERKNNMFENVTKNFKFGACGNAVKMSMYGPAFRGNNNDYIAFDKDNEAIDVTGMTFDFNCMYMMPAAIKDINKGDYIYHKDKPVKVLERTERDSFVCIDAFNKEEVTVVPVKSPFGFNFITKLVNFGEGIFGNNTIDEKNPFGSMLPYMMLSQSQNSGDNNGLMFALMMQNNGSAPNTYMNPMLMYFLMNNSAEKDSILPWMMMMNDYNHKSSDK